jgi:ankyrin repeat protein
MYASGYGRMGIVQILLNQGADINAQNHAGLTALDIAKRLQEQDLANWLKSQGAKETTLGERLKYRLDRFFNLFKRQKAS